MDESDGTLHAEDIPILFCSLEHTNTQLDGSQRGQVFKHGQATTTEAVIAHTQFPQTLHI